MTEQEEAEKREREMVERAIQIQEMKQLSSAVNEKMQNPIDSVPISNWLELTKGTLFGTSHSNYIELLKLASNKDEMSVRRLMVSEKLHFLVPGTLLAATDDIQSGIVRVVADGYPMELFVDGVIFSQNTKKPRDDVLQKRQNAAKGYSGKVRLTKATLFGIGRVNYEKLAQLASVKNEMEIQQWLTDGKAYLVPPGIIMTPGDVEWGIIKVKADGYPTELFAAVEIFRRNTEQVK